MARHSKLITFYQAFQRVSQYLGHFVTTDAFLRLCTSATRYGYGTYASSPKVSVKRAMFEQYCPGTGYWAHLFMVDFRIYKQVTSLLPMS